MQYSVSGEARASDGNETQLSPREAHKHTLTIQQTSTTEKRSTARLLHPPKSQTHARTHDTDRGPPSLSTHGARPAVAPQESFTFPDTNMDTGLEWTFVLTFRFQGPVQHGTASSSLHASRVGVV